MRSGWSAPGSRPGGGARGADRVGAGVLGLGAAGRRRAGPHRDRQPPRRRPVCEPGQAARGGRLFWVAYRTPGFLLAAARGVGLQPSRVLAGGTATLRPGRAAQARASGRGGATAASPRQRFAAIVAAGPSAMARRPANPRSATASTKLGTGPARATPSARSKASAPARASGPDRPSQPGAPHLGVAPAASTRARRPKRPRPHRPPQPGPDGARRPKKPKLATGMSRPSPIVSTPPTSPPGIRPEPRYRPQAARPSRTAPRAPTQR